ncbi:MAG: precorrin-2 C(20)-methyltransferase [Pseudomonadota bacterium]
MTGVLYGIGVGPGDPELLTLKAHRILTQCPVVAYPAPDDGESFARSIVSCHLRAEQIEIAIVIPMRIDRFPAAQIYDEKAKEIAFHLENGNDVAVLCEGDPFFYGSFMYLFERLAGEYPCEIVPGVSSLMACASALQRPLAARNDVLTILPGPLEDDVLLSRLHSGDAIAIIKVGRHFERIRTLIEKAGLMDRAGYLERASLPNQQVMPLDQVTCEKAPYFSMILIYKGAEDWIKELEVPLKVAQ